MPKRILKELLNEEWIHIDDFRDVIKEIKMNERNRIKKYLHQQFRHGKFILEEKKRFEGKTTSKDLDEWWHF